MSASIIELSVRVVSSDGTPPFESRLTVSADDSANAEKVAAAWVEMMRSALSLAALQREGRA